MSTAAGRLLQFMRTMTTSTAKNSNKRKVALLGAAGGIGQPLSMLLKMEAESISHLALYDVANMGMSVDIDHMATSVKVTGHQGESQIQGCLENAQIVIIPAGVPRKPGMTRDDLFNINGGIVKKLATACAQFCPDAHVLVISNPVNSTVPIAWEVMKAAGVSTPKVYGVTTLDTVRAKAFIGQLKGIDPAKVDVRVVGGHSGPTILPLLSSVPGVSLTAEEIKTLTHRVQYGGDEVVKAKDGAGSATLSMAFAARQFYQTLIQSLDGTLSSTTPEYRPIAYVKTDLFEPGYFASELEIGPSGIKKVHGLPSSLSPTENELLQAAIADLKREVKKGVDFARGTVAASSQQ